jgi:DnaJ-class molecular chaperone
LIVTLFNNFHEFRDPYSAPKLDFDECYYSVLEVKQFSNSADVKKGFYRLVSKYHPDTKEKDEDKKLCNKQMMVLNNAYKILKDDVLKMQYDSALRRGLKGAEAGVKGAASNARTSKKKPDSPRTSQPRYYTTRDDDASTASASRRPSSPPPRTSAETNKMFDDIAEFLRKREAQGRSGFYDDEELANTNMKRVCISLCY